MIWIVVLMAILFLGLYLHAAGQLGAAHDQIRAVRAAKRIAEIAEKNALLAQRLAECAQVTAETQRNAARGVLEAVEAERDMYREKFLALREVEQSLVDRIDAELSATLARHGVEWATLPAGRIPATSEAVREMLLDVVKEQIVAMVEESILQSCVMFPAELFPDGVDTNGAIKWRGEEDGGYVRGYQ